MESTYTRPQGRSGFSSNWRVKDTTPASSLSSDRQHEAASPAPSGTRLYIGNLEYKAMEEDVKELFSSAGFTVQKLDINIDPETQRNPSYCFLDLASPEECERAIQQMNGADLFGRNIRVNYHTPKPRGERTENRFGTSSPRFRNDNREASPRTFGAERYNRNDSREQQPREPQPINELRLYIGGLPRIEPASQVEVEMRELFDGFQITEITKLIAPHPSKSEEPGNHYYLFVDFASAEDATSAMAEINGADTKFGQLRVSQARGENRKPRRDQPWGRGESRDVRQEL